MLLLQSQCTWCKVNALGAKSMHLAQSQCTWRKVNANVKKKSLHATLYLEVPFHIHNKMLKAYVRDPNELFVQHQSGLAKKFHNVAFTTDPDTIMHTV